MLDLGFVRENLDLVRKAMVDRSFPADALERGIAEIGLLVNVNSVLAGREAADVAHDVHAIANLREGDRACHVLIARQSRSALRWLESSGSHLSPVLHFHRAGRSAAAAPG